ncbi:sugar ABC transporter permease [Treponema phagedenis]|uniref:ABC transporter, permease protein n=1 Tax=Treponema phagedenis TaxID=162 RepID=A0A0B7H1G3_TREPH|nr:sugar ABC transporter permease [Treponema phagedenis]NVP25067.1 sugar ABC transporter permease [Treponema phagedenis]QEJ94021.1 sugar ABC transporter permease [Treponema phagedenis]QEJ97180.1 sugar ABC transporter permease [Treponema phagedenis]QEK01971.1 sugar ABC transporter permease [Treponema phagedenis]QEK02630.1 sugar ABC transporter permease [Treponema phagedenis]
MRKNKGVIAVFILPAASMFIIVFLYPILRTIVMSFFKIEGITDSVSRWSFVGFANYAKLMKTGLFHISLWNLARIWFIGGIIVMSLALLFAVILTSGIKFKRFFRAVIYLPNIVSAVALATMWLQYVYSPKFGLLKSFFTSIGWERLAQVQWLDNEHKFMALLLAYCFGMVGYHMLIFLSGIERIGTEYFEAATLDGANKPEQFWYITLPLLKGVFRINITMWTVTSVGFFVWSQFFSTVTADTQTITPMVYLYLQIFGAGNSITERNSGVGAAVGVLLCICVVTVFSLCNHLLKDKDLEF